MSSSHDEPHEYFGPFDRYRLDNGLTVLLKPVDHSRSVTAQVWVRAGSAYENDANNGLSHLLEHMLFKGTDRFSGWEVNDLVEEAGGRQNAATSKEYTKYFITLPSKHWERALEILSQMAFHAALPQDEFDKERRVVLSELARYEDNPKRRLWLDFIPRLYGGHPYGRLTIGSRKVLESVTHADLVDYYEQFYRPSNTTLVVAGQFPEQELRTSVQEYFGISEIDESSPDLQLESVPDSPDGTLERRTADLRQAYGLLGTAGADSSTNRVVGMDLLAEVLGGNQDSRLYEQLVIEESLVSDVSVSFLTLRAGGPLMLRFNGDPERIDAALDSLRNVIGKLFSEGIRPDELERAKTSLKSDRTYAAQTASGQATKLGFWESLGQLNQLETYVDQLEALTAEDVTELGRTYLPEGNWNGALVVPEE